MQIKLFQSTIIISFIISAGLFLRTYHPGSYPFGYDQIQILENAEKITQGDITLIGPRTGPAQMFTGPLIYYVTALLLLIIADPWVLVITSTLISVVTGFTIYLLFKVYFNINLARIATTIWAFSPYIISLDRITWNPNLSLLASTLVFIPCFNILKANRIRLLDFVLSGLGVFLGYQAHFTTLMLIGFVWLTLIFHAQINKKSILLFLATGFMFIISLIPTLIFDIRNQWLNLNGLIDFADQPSTFNMIRTIQKFITNLYITCENIGKILFLHNDKFLIIATGIVIILIFIYTNYLQKNLRSKTTYFTLIWLLAPAILYSMYRGETPEYYFLIQLPAIIYLFTDIIKQINKKHQLAIISFISIYVLLLTNSIYTKTQGMNMINQVQAANFIKRIAQDHPEGVKLSYDVKPVDSLGLKYLLSDIPTLQNSSTHLHISLSTNSHQLSKITYGNINIWIDPRTDNNLKFLEKESHIIQYPNSLQLYEDYSLEYPGSSNVYQILSSSGEKLGVFVYYLNDGSNDFRKVETMTNLAMQYTIKVGDWNELKSPIRQYFQFDHEHNLSIIYPVHLDPAILEKISISIGTSQ